MRLGLFAFASLGIALAACDANGGKQAAAITGPSSAGASSAAATEERVVPANEVGGPSNMVIRDALKDFEVMRIPGHGFETFDRIKNIRHGQALEATGSGDIPGGTAIYPIKVDSSDGKDYVFAFYQDSFGEWKFQRME